MPAITSYPASGHQAIEKYHVFVINLGVHRRTGVRSVSMRTPLCWRPITMRGKSVHNAAVTGSRR
jgi:hypothetical protein